VPGFFNSTVLIVREQRDARVSALAVCDCPVKRVRPISGVHDSTICSRKDVRSPPLRSTFFIACRDAFGLVVVVSLLIIVCLPLLVASRENARRNQCIAKLRLLAEGVVEWDELHGHFPTAITVFSSDEAWLSTGRENGLTSAGPNWAVMVAEQMGEEAFMEELRACAEFYADASRNFPWNSADDCSSFGNQIGSFRPMGTPSFMSCPSATPSRLPHTSDQTQLANLAKGNYAGCLGAGTYFESIDGSRQVDAFVVERSNAEREDDVEVSGQRLVRRGTVTVRVGRIYVDRHFASRGAERLGLSAIGGVRIKDIKDGTSRTMLLSEVLTVDGSGAVANASEDIRGVWVSPSMGASTYSHFTTPNSLVRDRINGCETDLTQYPKGSRLPCLSQPATGPTAGDTHAAARSEHVGGVVSARADSSVQFYSNEIDPRVWTALGTRAASD
jgi:hypothetical protein